VADTGHLENHRCARVLTQLAQQGLEILVGGKILLAVE
jgi:hypothetical protein